MRGRIYITQYGDWWSMNLKTWIEVCRKGAAGECFYYEKVSGVKALKGPPWAGQWLRTHKPLDWEVATWREHLSKAEEELRNEKSGRD